MSHTHSHLFCAALLALACLRPSAGRAEEGAITVLPSIESRAEPDYPPAALRDRVEATVTVEFEIAETGQVAAVDWVSTSTRTTPATRSSTVTDYGFRAAALAAAQRFRFRPALAGNTPVSVRVPYRFDFVLPEALTQAVTDPKARPGILRFSGVVRERGTRAVLAGVRIEVFQGTEMAPTQRQETFSDADGKFQFFDLRPGRWYLRGNTEGYYPIRAEEFVRAQDAIEATYFMERAAYSPYDVIVETARTRKEVNRRRLKASEIAKVPGTLGDPILVVENLPGVARTAGGGEIIVRGSAPEDTRVLVESIEVPLIYHFGGLRSVLPSDFIEAIDFFPGNYSVQFGRAMGGILDAQLKRLDPDQLHGSVDLSLLDASVFLEAPLGDNAAFAIAGRRSHVDLVLKAVIPDDSDVALVAPPRYYDYQLMTAWRPKAGHNLRLVLIGSDDQLRLLFDNPADFDPQLPANFENTASFTRVIADYQYRVGKRFQNRFTAAGGEDQFRIAFGDEFFIDIHQYLIEFRDTATWKLSDALAIDFGANAQFNIVDFDIRAPRPPQEGAGEPDPDLDDVLETGGQNESLFFFAPYVEADWRPIEALSLRPGLRLDYFDFVDALSVDPRFVARYAINKQWTSKAGVGVTHQVPLPYETDEVFGNPDLGLERAVQYSAGVEWQPVEHINIDTTLFFKDMQNLVSSTDRTVVREGRRVPLVFDNNGSGRVFGLEIFAQHAFSNNLRGWLSYTLSRAERTDSGSTRGRLFDFDQTHIFAMVASYLFPENWELGLRWRIVSGNLTTPVRNGVYFSDDDVYRRTLGPVNSERLPLFHQLDIRLDKKWVFDRWQLAAYLSLVNTYNRGNPEAYAYDPQYLEREAITGLPLFPILGIRGEL